MIFFRRISFFFLMVFWTGASLSAVGDLLAAKLAEPDVAVQADFPGWEPPVEIGFWNIRWFPGYHPVNQDERARKKQSREVARLLESWSPDIFFACEVRDLEALRGLDLDFPYMACTAVRRTEDENPDLPRQGIAVLSRVPWEECWVLDFSELPLTADKPSRGILGVKFRLPNQMELVCYAVHLKSNRGGIEATHPRRERAIDYVARDLERRNLNARRDFIMVLGDFNTSREDPAFRSDQTHERLEALGFLHSGDAVPREERLTMAPGRYPANDFDHIMISSALREAIRSEQEVRTVDGEISDHHAVFLDLSELFSVE